MTERTDVSGLVDMEGINRAAGLFAVVKARHAEATLTLEAAEAEVAALRLRLPALIERAAAGVEALTPEAVDAAHDAVRRAVAFATAASAVQVRVHALRDRAADALADAKAEGWAAVLRRGFELRIEAGRRLDLARAMAPGGTRAWEEVARRDFLIAKADEIRPVFEEGNRLVNLALANGARMPPQRGWLPEFEGLTEARERKHWGIQPGEETARAA